MHIRQLSVPSLDLGYSYMEDNVQEHRCVDPITIELYHPSSVGFSNFQFLEDSFGAFVANRDSAVRRCFSLARMLGTKTIVRELIEPSGMLLYEHQQIAQKYASGDRYVYRFSFWREFLFCKDELEKVTSEECLGYAIIQTISLRDGEKRLNVFEAVFQPVLKSNWVLPRIGVYDLNVGGCKFSIHGNLYCQQDGISTVCAHVALRTLISRVSPLHDISYEKIDRVARKVRDIDLELGLTIEQIEAVLDDAQLRYEDFCYDKDLISEEIKATFVSDDMPIERLIHSGVESGQGTLFGFKVDHKESSIPIKTTHEKSKKDSRHIIPIFGHSFNGLSWFNEAGRQYFRNKHENALYATGTCWTDGYLGHDDNVGPEVFIPQNYVQDRYHSYVLNLLKPDYRSAGVFVEDIARELMETYIGAQLPKGHQWALRLRQMVRYSPTAIVYRAISVTRCDYCKWLMQTRDWAGAFESESDCLKLEKELPVQLWVVEVSCQHLYPCNLRKIGDIVFDAKKIDKRDRSRDTDLPLFVLARFPALYMLHPQFAIDVDTKNEDNGKALVYEKRGSRLCSHTPCIPVGAGSVISNV